MTDTQLHSPMVKPPRSPTEKMELMLPLSRWKKMATAFITGRSMAISYWSTAKRSRRRVRTAPPDRMPCLRNCVSIPKPRSGKCRSTMVLHGLRWVSGLKERMAIRCSSRWIRSRTPVWRFLRLPTAENSKFPCKVRWISRFPQREAYSFTMRRRPLRSRARVSNGWHGLNPTDGKFRSKAMYWRL